MLDQAKYTPRMKADYMTRIKPAMMTEFGYTNAMQLPRLDKIVLNMGVGEAVKDTKKVKKAAEELTLIAGQKAVVDGVNMAIRHTKQSAGSQGGRIPKAMPIDLSNLAIVDKNGKATRVGFRMDGDKKVRFAKTTGEAI